MRSLGGRKASQGKTLFGLRLARHPETAPKGGRGRAVSAIEPLESAHTNGTIGISHTSAAANQRTWSGHHGAPWLVRIQESGSDMLDIDDIQELDGYQELENAINSALSKMVNKEPVYMFSVDEQVDISDWAKRTETHSTSSYAWSPREMLEGLVSGNYFSAIERMEDQWFSQGTYERDDDWYKEKTEKILDDDLSDEVSTFAERHELDEDDLKKVIKEKFESEPKESLHYINYRFIGTASVLVDLEIAPTLQPSVHLIDALSRLGISAQDWLDAVQKNMDQDPPDDAELDSVFNAEDFEGFRDSFNKSMIWAASSKVFLPATSANALVSPDELVNKLRGDWSGQDTSLSLMMKLGEDHFENVSQAVNRYRDSEDDIANTLITISDAQLCPTDGVEYLEGITVSKPVTCRIGSLRVTTRDIGYDVQEADTAVAGVYGLRAQIHKELSWAEERPPFAGLPLTSAAMCSVGSHQDQEKIEKARECLRDDGVTKRFEKLMAGYSWYELEQCAPIYPGMASHFAAAIEKAKQASSGEQLSGRMVEILRSFSLVHNKENWLASEERNEVVWLLERGAHPDSRVPTPHPDQQGPTALHLAIGYNDLDLAERMIKRGANPLATFHTPGDDAFAKQGLWEVIARNALTNEAGSGSDTRAAELSETLSWAESFGCAPQDFEQFNHKGVRTDTWRCLAAFNDLTLTQRHIERLPSITGGHTQAMDEHMRRALNFALCRTSVAVAIPLIDAGVSIDAPNPERQSETIRESATKYRERVTGMSDKRQEAWEQIIRYAESKNALALISRIARQGQPAPTH